MVNHVQLYKILNKINYKINKLKIKNTKINSICTNSKQIKKGDLFISLKSNKNNQKKYIIEAFKKGAYAIISDTNFKFQSKNLGFIYFKNIKDKILQILIFYYSELTDLNVAITGTNGKTSVAWYVYNILLKNKIKSSYLGTLGHYCNNKKISDLNLTTPDQCSLFRISNFNSFNGSNIFIFEASSHGLSQKRILGLPIKIAAITNITKDHIDYHKNMQNYKKAKLTLFTKYLENSGTAIINSNIKLTNQFKNVLKNKSINLITYGSEKSQIHIIKDKKFYKIKINKNIYKIPNIFYNTYDSRNFECAIAICLALKINLKLIIKKLKYIPNPPGRMEKCIKLNNNAKVILDYAHTPDALKNILLSSIIFNNQKSNILFGCGGNRDKSKRQIMGRIAKKYAEKIYLTDDNPRNEKPEKIISSIFKGCPEAKKISGRKKAIAIAIKELKRNETLIIAGKGDEKFQIIGNKKIPFDDIKLANSFIKKLNNEKVKY